MVAVVGSSDPTAYSQSVNIGFSFRSPNLATLSTPFKQASQDATIESVGALIANFNGGSCDWRFFNASTRSFLGRAVFSEADVTLNQVSLVPLESAFSVSQGDEITIAIGNNSPSETTNIWADPTTSAPGLWGEIGSFGFAEASPGPLPVEPIPDAGDWPLIFWYLDGQPNSMVGPQNQPSSSKPMGNDSLKEFLISQGFSMPLNEAEVAFLASLGYSGPINEQLKQKALAEGYSTVTEMMSKQGIQPQ